MARVLFDPAIYNDIGLTGILPMILGGTGATTAATAAASMGWIPRSMLGVANGVVKLDAGVKIPLANLPGGANALALLDGTAKVPVSALPTEITEGGVTLAGPIATYLNEPTVYVLTGYNVFDTYAVSTTNGTVTRSGATITYTPASTTNGGFTVDDTTFTITVLEAGVATPSIITPEQNGTQVSEYPTLKSSAFDYLGISQSQDQVRWEISTSNDFTSGVQFYEGSANLTEWMPTTALTESTQYYARVRHHSVLGGWSSWSATVAFTTHHSQGWVLKHMKPASSSILPFIAALTMDSATGHIYIVGRQNHAVATIYEAYIAKYNPDGTLVWEYAFAANTQFYDIALDSSGDLYVVGYRADSAGGSQKYPLILKLNSDGLVVWGKYINYTPLSIHSALTAIYIDSADNIYVAGLDFSIIRYTTSGSVVWARFRNTVGNTLSATFEGVATDSQGNVYAAGHYTDGSGDEFGYLIKCDSAGATVWERSLYCTQLSSKLTFNSLVVDSSDNIYVGGGVEGTPEPFISRWDTSGNLIWKTGITTWMNFETLATDATGNIYAASGTGDIVKFTSAGTPLWGYKFDGDGSVNTYSKLGAVADLILAPNNVLYMAGYCTFDTLKDQVLIKMSADGPAALGPLTGANMTNFIWMELISYSGNPSASLRTVGLVIKTSGITQYDISLSKIPIDMRGRVTDFSEY